jgi:hypothetical protein
MVAGTLVHRADHGAQPAPASGGTFALHVPKHENCSAQAATNALPSISHDHAGEEPAQSKAALKRVGHVALSSRQRDSHAEIVSGNEQPALSMLLHVSQQSSRSALPELLSVHVSAPSPGGPVSE